MGSWGRTVRCVVSRTSFSYIHTTSWPATRLRQLQQLLLRVRHPPQRHPQRVRPPQQKLKEKLSLHHHHPRRGPSSYSAMKCPSQECTTTSGTMAITTHGN